MAKKKVEAELAPSILENDPTGRATAVVLSSTPASLIEQVDRGQSILIPLPKLVPFYVQADKIKKRLEALMAKAKEGILPRRDEGDKSGDKNQHRIFHFGTDVGDCELTVQERRSWKPNEEKLTALLKEKKLWEAATDLRITTSGDSFQKFLRAHRKELKTMGVEIVEELNSEKVNGLVMAKLITTDELENILDKPDPTYALIPKMTSTNLNSSGPVKY